MIYIGDACQDTEAMLQKGALAKCTAHAFVSFSIAFPL